MLHTKFSDKMSNRLMPFVLAVVLLLSATVKAQSVKSSANVFGSLKDKETKEVIQSGSGGRRR